MCFHTEDGFSHNCKICGCRFPEPNEEEIGEKEVKTEYMEKIKDLGIGIIFIIIGIIFSLLMVGWLDNDIFFK